MTKSVDRFVYRRDLHYVAASTQRINRNAVGAVLASEHKDFVTLFVQNGELSGKPT